MAPNISNKSVYIIFIISINIVSMVCHYQPIKISYLETERQKYYTYQDYLDYLDEETKDFEKLDYQQFFNSMFNPEYKFSHHYDNKRQMRLEIKNFCNDKNKFIPFTKYKTMNQIIILGRHVKIFRNCIKSSNCNSFDTVKSSYINTFNTEMTVAQLSNNLTSKQKTELQKCINNFRESIKYIFDDLNESDLEFDFNNNIIGKHVYHLMRIVTSNDDDYFDVNDKDNELILFQNLYKEITQYKEADTLIRNVTIYTEDEQNACKKYYETNTIDYYIPMPEIFEGFDNYDDFIKHLAIKIKYLLTIEGPLINNKELYEIYFTHPITLNNYNELRKPIPLFHETMYSVYSLRLQKLGYLPLHEKTWNTIMEKLLWSTTWDKIYSTKGIKSYIEYIMKIEEDEIYNYEIE